MFRRLLLCAAFAAIAVSANAAKFTVTPQFVGAFQNDGAFTPIPGFDITANPNSTVVLQYDFMLNFDGEGDGTFGAVVFDINMGPGLSGNGDVPGWQATNPTIDFNGGLPGGAAPLFATAGDLGLTDLKNITAGIAANLTTNPAVDPRLQIGTGAGTNLGTLYVNWTGTAASTLSVDIIEAGYRNTTNGALIVDASPTFIEGSVDIGDDGGTVVPGVFASTPAPGSVLDFGYGPDTRTLQLAVRNSAAVGAENVAVTAAVITGADASLFSTPGFAPLNLVAGAADSSIGVQFNGIGTPGVYSAMLELRGEGGAVLGTYTLTARVPEPSTIALAGLGLLGLVGFARRRG